MLFRNTYSSPYLAFLFSFVFLSPGLFAKVYTGNGTANQYQGPLDASDDNQKVIRVALDVGNGGGTPTCSGMTFNITGFGDVAEAKLYYTLQSATFNTSNLLGTVIPPFGASISFTFAAVDNGAANGLWYYWLVIKMNGSITSGTVVDASYVSGTYTTGPPTVNGPNPSGFRFTGRNYNIGTGEQYATIGAVSTAIAQFDYDGAADIFMEMTTNYTNTETGCNFVFTNHSGPANIIIRPALGQTGKITECNPGTGQEVIELSGVQKIIFDGRPGGVGTAREWTIRNTQTTPTVNATIGFVNDASNNTLTYLNLEGEAAPDLGIVYFQTTSATTGNDNNTISYCHIRDIQPSGGTIPAQAIYSNGTVGKENNGNTIDNCHFYDIYNVAQTAGGYINLFANNNSWSITNNHFYQTAGAYAGTGSTSYSFIQMRNEGGYTITGNYIGGTAPNCGGTPLVMIGTGISIGIVIANNFAASSSAVSTISNNTISNINVTSSYGSASSIFRGISVTGTLNYTMSNNTIGSTTAVNNIVATNNGTSSLGSTGILSNSSGTVTVSDNTISGMTTNGTTSGSTMRGIWIGGAGTANILSNSIGNQELRVESQSVISGIDLGSGGGGIKKNFVRNLNNTSTGGTRAINGLLIAGSAWDVHNNVVILNNGANTNDMPLYGIQDNNSSTINVYHNTVKVSGTGTGTSFTASLYRLLAGTDNVKNNIFQNTRTGGSGGNYAIYAATSAATYTGDYNYLEVTENTGKTGFWAGTGDRTFALWQTSAGETNSITGTTTINANGYAPPAFVGANAGTDLFIGSIVTIDKTDFPRDINPWMGAYEYSAGNMSYNSSTTTQTNSSGLAKGSSNNQIIGIEILMNNTDNPLAATSFTFNTTGTTNPATDIQNARLWTTGNSSGFATTSQLGAAVAAPNGSFTITGFSYTLNPGNNYFWLTYDIPSGATTDNNVDAECTSLIVDGISRTPLIAAPAGFRIIGNVFSVCPSGCDYTSIQLAYNAVPASLAGNYFIQLSSTYTDVNEPATGINFAAKTMNGYTITVRPAPGVTGKIVDYAPGALNNLWTFDGAKNVIIDGRPGGIGSNREFTIRNTGAPAVNSTVFTFINDASNNTLTYLNIEADVAVADNKGLILFSTTTGTTGNDNNTISFCHIRDWSVADGGNAALPRNGIYCYGTVGKENSGNTIDNCQFYNICETSDASYNSFSIYLVAGADDWSITNNHFYQTASYSFTVASSIQPVGFIDIDATGGSYIVSGNYLGGTATNAAGTAFTITGGDRSFQSILFNGTVTAGLNTITNNTIANINITTSYTGTLTPFVGIAALHNSNFTIGGSAGNGNTIGSTGASGGITLTHNGTQTRGIRAIVTTGTGTNTVSYNTIAGLTVGGTLAGADTRFISCDGSGTYNILNNNLGNANNNSVVSSNSKVTGIFVNTGGGSIKKNFIRGLTNTAAAGTRAIIGMDIAGTTWDVHNNVILLNNGSNSNDMPVYGIQDNNSSTLNIYHNTVKIYGTGSGTSFTAALYRLLAGTDNVKNNIFQNTRIGGTGGNYSIYAAVTTGTFTNDDNYLEVTENTGKLCFWSGTGDQTLANWITNTSATAETITGTTAIDANGYAPPAFVGANAGTDLYTGSIVTDDKDSKSRDAAPWMGAYEGGSGNMVYISSTTTQNNTGDLFSNTTNNEIIGIRIVTDFPDNPLNVSSFTFSTNGTTNASADIQNAKLWTTGVSSAFATATQLGSAFAAPNGSFTISGFTYTLANGTNYFWLTYDVTAGATNCNNVDAECTSLIVSAVSQTPAPTAPAGKRSITSASLSYTWANNIGSGTNDVGNDIAVDGSGNTYITGSFTGTADFDPGAGTANLISGGGLDIFFAKYDANGNYVWAKSIGNTSGDAGTSIAVDASGNTYITGYFQGTVDFDPGAGTANLSSVTLGDIFFAKYDASGNYLWAYNIGGSGTVTDQGYGIAVDGSGNVYITGYFQNTADFDPIGTANLTSVGDWDIYFAKYNTSGNYLWAGNIGSASADAGYSIAVDGSGNVYITGSFTGTADFDPGAGTANLSAVASADIFYAKYNSSGSYLWAKSIGSTSDDYGYSIALDGSGNTFITGNFQGSADFNPGAGTATLTPVGSIDIFFAKYDGNGNYLWANNIGGPSGDGGNGIAVDLSGSAYISGYFQGTADFDPGAGTANLISVGSGDICFAKYDGNGNYLWAKNIGSASFDQGNSIAVGSNNTYITGYFQSTADFDPGAGTANLTSVGGNDIFYAKYTTSCPGTITTSAIAPTTLCRGGSLTIAYTITGTFNAGNVFTAQLSDAAGSFAAPTNIGNVTATTNTSITATIPIGTASGTGYRIRVVSSDPAVTGTNNGSDLTVPADGGAGTWTWVGGISTSWFDRCNWDKKSLPDASSDVIIPGGTVNDPTITGAAANCKTITIDTGNSGIVNLNSTAGGVLNVAQ